MNNVFRPALCALLLALPGVAGAASALDLADVVASTDVLATHTCTAIAEMDFAARFAKSVATRRPSEKLTIQEVRQLLEAFDRITIGFCDATRLAARQKKAEVLKTFADTYVVKVSPEWENFLNDPEARKWAADDAAFQVQVLPLAAHFALLTALHPDSLGAEWRDPSPLRFLARDERELRKQYERTTIGTTGAAYRRMVAFMLADSTYASVAPRNYHLQNLAATEKSLFQRGVRVTQRGASYSQLESTYIRNNIKLQDLLKPALQAPYVAALKALEDASTSGIDTRPDR